MLNNLALVIIVVNKAFNVIKWRLFYILDIINTCMWLKKFFNLDKKEQATDQPIKQQMEQQDQATDSKITVVPQEEVDLRYSRLRIIKTKKLHIPQNQIHFTESVFLQERQLIQAKSKFNEGWTNIEIIISDRQILIIPNILVVNTKKTIHKNNILHIFLGMIQRLQLLQIKRQTPKLVFTLKDYRCFLIQSINFDKLKQIEKIIRQFAFPDGINKLYAFKYGKINKPINGWKIYDFQKQMRRQNVWKYTYQYNQFHQPAHFHSYQLIDNQSFQLSPTYPQRFIVPIGLDDNQIIKCSKFRTKERLPILTYFFQYKPGCFVSLFRCSQNKGGIMTNRCPQDEKMISEIDKSVHNISSQKRQINDSKINCKIYDARGYYAAWGNKLAGKGFQNEQYYNCEIQFLNIPNIHAVRDSFNRVKTYNPEKDTFIEVLGQSGWVDYLFLILSGAKSMADTMKNGKNVIVHCSDGWDRTTQLSCLTQIMIQPYYRTIQGFIVLVEKDWRHYGHKFRVRSGLYNQKDYHPNQKSPIFLQFLDCIRQIMNQFPLSFEYNSAFLNFLAFAYQSNTYGTFLTNNIKQCKQIKLQQQTVSVWCDILEDKAPYLNIIYQSNGPKILDISVDSKDFIIWSQFLVEQESVNSEQISIMRRQIEINKQMKQKQIKLDIAIEKARKQIHQRV